MADAVLPQQLQQVIVEGQCVMPHSVNYLVSLPRRFDPRQPFVRS